MQAKAIRHLGVATIAVGILLSPGVAFLYMWHFSSGNFFALTEDGVRLFNDVINHGNFGWSIFISIILGIVTIFTSVVLGVILISISRLLQSPVTVSTNEDISYLKDQRGRNKAWICPVCQKNNAGILKRCWNCNNPRNGSAD